MVWISVSQGVGVDPVSQWFTYAIVREGVIAENIPQNLQEISKISWRNKVTFVQMSAKFRRISAKLSAKKNLTKDPISELLRLKSWWNAVANRA